MNFSGALMGAANASQGYLQGRQEAIDNGLRNQLNALNLQNAQDQVQQQQQQRQSQAAIIDAMMMHSASQPPNLRAGQPQPQGQPQDPTQMLTQQGEALSRGMNAALQTGNLDAYQKLSGMYEDSQTKLSDIQDKQAAVILSGLKANQQEYQTVARMFQGVTNSQEFNSAMKQVLDDPNIPQASKQNLMQMSYSPNVVRLIVSRGFSAAENARAQIDAQTQAERVRHDQQTEGETRRKNTADLVYKGAQLASKQHANKVGMKIPTPSANDITLASAYVKNNLGLTGDTSTNENFKQGINTVASIAKQLMASQRAYSYPAALAMATHIAQENGQLNIKDTPATSGKELLHPSTWLNSATPEQKTLEAASQKGALSSNPIPLPHGATAQDLMPGMWYHYVKNGKPVVGQWDGEKFIPMNSTAAM